MSTSTGKTTLQTFKKKALLWFRNDLRIHDNESLIKALKLASNTSNTPLGILPLYCFDPRHFGFSRIGKFRKSNANRTRFLSESVDILRKNLYNEWGLKLMVQIGHPEEIIPQLCEQYEINHVFADKEVTSEETSVEIALEKKTVAVNYSNGFSMVNVDDLPFKIDNLPHVFTDFRRKVENPKIIVRPLLELSKNEKKQISSRIVNLVNDEKSLGNTPDLKTLGYTDEEISEMINNLKDTRSVLNFKGGEDEGLARLKDYLWTHDRLKTYKDTRNGLVGEAYSSKLSPWLALGCLSPRMIYHEVKRYEKERIENESTYWLIFELLWRDYFRFFAEKFGNNIFMLKGVTRSSKKKGLLGDSKNIDTSSSYDSQRWKQDMKLFQQWADGKTGLPFVDANMRELKISGWMSNRGRQNVASFLSKDLNLDWRLGAEYFESLLLDHSVTSNWGNWLYSAGVGDVDPRGEARYFNVVKQGYDYDFNGEFVRMWIPELKDVPQRCIHAPYLMNESQQTQSKCTIGVEYPKPVVNVKAHQQLTENGVKENYKHKTGKANERERKIR